MRIATYNVEWFSNLFDDAGTLLNDAEWSGRHDIQRGQQASALVRVFRALDADAIMVIEAPDSHAKRDGVAALEGFAARYHLRTRRAIIGFANETQQEIALLYDPDVISARHDPQDGPGAPRFDTELAIDLDVDAAPEKVRFSKPPLEIALETRGGKQVRLIGVHAKSKAPHGARNERQARAISIANRRKQLAQCIWIRRRVEAHFAAGDPLIVLGDFNDGPGLDEYETLFGRSGVEIVLGTEGQQHLFDPHAAQALQARFIAAPTTARFFLHPEGRYLEALLDYIMVSPDLRDLAPDWRIWHPFDDPECFEDKKLHQALLDASDHFPVTLDLALV